MQVLRLRPGAGHQPWLLPSRGAVRAAHPIAPGGWWSASETLPDGDGLLHHLSAKKSGGDGKSEYRPAMGRYSPAEGEVLFRLLRSGGRGQPEKEYLLTRRQALKVIMRSETEQVFFVAGCRFPKNID